MSLIYNATFDKNTRKLSFEDKAGNEIYSFIVPERAPAVDDIKKPLTFKSTQGGSTVKLTKEGYPVGSFQTSRDGGNTWEDYTLYTPITLNTGDEVSFRAKADRTSGQNASRYFYFEMTGKIEAWHNVLSMKTDDFAASKPVGEYQFFRLFNNCASLTKAPILPSARLASNCYNSMFYGCQSLTKAPVLYATILAESCCAYMFEGCVSLTKAPVLHASTLVLGCYSYMFSGCKSLKEVRIAATTKSTNALKNWLRGVAATGDFYCDPYATFLTTGASGIPANWRRLNINDYPN